MKFQASNFYLNSKYRNGKTKKTNSNENSHCVWWGVLWLFDIYCKNVVNCWLSTIKRTHNILLCHV